MPRSRKVPRPRVIVPPGFLGGPKADRFGLPLVVSLLDSEETKTGSKADVEALATALFSAAVRVLGEDEARAVWKAASTKPKGPKGSRHPRHDRLLLRAYDAAVRDAGGSEGAAPARVAAVLHLRLPGIYGNSAAAIERHVRRLVKERESRPRLVGEVYPVPSLLEEWTE